MNPPGRTFVSVGCGLVIDSARAAPSGRSLAASFVGAAAVAGDVGSRLLEIYDQHVVPHGGRPPAGLVARDAVVGQEGFAGHDVGRAVVTDTTDDIRMGCIPGYVLDADELILAVVKKRSVPGRTDSANYVVRIALH